MSLLLVNVAAVVVVLLAVAKLALFLLTIFTYINALVVSAKPRSVFLPTSMKRCLFANPTAVWMYYV